MSTTLVPGKISLGSTTCRNALRKLAVRTAIRASFSNCFSAPHEMSPFRFSSSANLGYFLQLSSSICQRNSRTLSAFILPAGRWKTE